MALSVFGGFPRALAYLMGEEALPLEKNWTGETSFIDSPTAWSEVLWGLAQGLAPPMAIVVGAATGVLSFADP